MLDADAHTLEHLLVLAPVVIGADADATTLVIGDLITIFVRVRSSCAEDPNTRSLGVAVDRQAHVGEPTILSWSERDHAVVGAGDEVGVVGGTHDASFAVC